MDHAATTPVSTAVLEAMLPFFSARFHNPSSVYAGAANARQAVEHAREQVAAAIGASPAEIAFTSGGTEADNWAIRGTVISKRKKGDHIITSQIEHHAVLHTCKQLEKEGFGVTYLPVDEYGRVDPGDLDDAITGRTVLISIMAANNEIGTIQPIGDIGRIAREHGIAFHTDAVQAIGSIGIDVDAMNIDLLSLSAHKFYGPKGAGALYIRKGVSPEPLMHGGGQERKRRAGTENVPGIVGLGAAIGIASSGLEERSSRFVALRDRLIRGLLEVPDSHLNGHPSERLPNNANVRFDYIEGESILLMLEAAGVYASTGSACTSASLEPSHVMLACGIPPEKAHGSLRLTLGKDNTEDDVDYVIEKIPGIVARLREISPLTPENRRGA